MWKECNMPFLFKLAQRVARLRSRLLLVTAAAVAGACARELAAPASGKPPVTLQISAADATPGGSVAVVLRATEPLTAIQETVAFDAQRLRYERPGDGPDLVVVNDEAAAQGSLKVLATNPQGLASTGVTLVFTVTASGYIQGVRGTLELAVAPDDQLVWGADPSATDRVAGSSPSAGYRFGDVNLDGLINVWDVLSLSRASAGTGTLGPQAFLRGNVRAVNGGATATAVPPCDPATSCRPGVTPADAQTPNGRIDSAAAVAVASVVVGVSVPVVGQLVPTALVTPDTAVASVTISPAPASVQVGQTLQLTATPKDSAGGILVGRTVTWASGNPSIATVSPSGQVTGAAPGAAPITATSEGKSGTATLTVTTVPVASVPLSPATATVLVGQTLQLTATPKDSAGGTLTGRTVTFTVTTGPVASVTVSPATASVAVGQTLQLTATPKDSTGTALTGRSVTWVSSNPGVATVSSNGLVTSGAVGTATITATSEGKAGSAAVTVTPVPVASVTVSPATASIRVAQTVQLTATPKDSAGGTLAGRTVTWRSGDTTVATVSPSGLVTGLAAGSASITATSEGKSRTAGITVTPVPVASVAVAPATASLTVGQTAQLTATPKDSAGTALTGRTVTWASSNTSMATVSSSGLVKGVAAGTATITATSEGKAGTAAATVTLVPVATVVVSPAPATLPLHGTIQLNVTLKDASGNPLTGRSVAWTSSTPTVMTVSPTGLVTDVADGGTATVTATSEGKSGTSVVTVQAPLPAGSVADPTLLPVASGQGPNMAAYTALNVASQPAGFSYTDPVTGVKVWKVTSSSVPTANPHAGHDYAHGPNEVSRGWGAGNNTHTILFYAGIVGVGSPYYLVDFTRGVGFTNYRQLPAGAQPVTDLCFSFSSVVGQERIAYVINGNQVKRFNTATMQVENTGFFPLTGTFQRWLHQDKNDIWFTGLQDNSTAFAWNSQTNELRTHSETWLNEPRLERDGRYIALTTSNSTIRLWDLATNTFGPTQTDVLNIWLGHNANLRGMWVTTDVNASAPFDLDRYYPSGGQIVKTRFLNNSAGAGVHHAGNWVQSDAELGGNLNRQWSFVGGVDNNAFTATALWKQAIGVMRADGSDARLLVHHYSTNSTYSDDPFVKPSPDGKVVMFDSNMAGSGRYDVFVAEMPLR